MHLKYRKSPVKYKVRRGESQAPTQPRASLSAPCSLTPAWRAPLLSLNEDYKKVYSVLFPEASLCRVPVNGQKISNGKFQG